MPSLSVSFDEQKFRTFQLRRSSIQAYFHVMIGLTFFITRDLLIAYFVRFSITKMINCSLLLATLFFGWLLCSLKFSVQHIDGNESTSKFQKLILFFHQTIFRTNENRKLTEMIHFIEDIFVDLSTLGIGMSLIYKSTYGDCGTLNFLLSTATCNYEHACGSLPDDLTSLFVIVPLLHKVLFKGASWKAILRSTAITTMMILYCIVITKSWSSLYLLLVTLPFVLMMLFELRRQSVEMFMLTETLNQSLNDNEKMAEELRLHEMKMMIGNIAHDLKTPLTAFFSGLDEINTLGSDLKAKLVHLFKVQKISSSKQNYSNKESILWSASKDSSILQLEEKTFHLIDHIQQCVETSKSINSFMLMSINRCIDFTKVRHGVTLKSKMETGRLQELLNVPLKCMRDMQSLIEIKLFPPPSTICSHIITDKQWFQENLLCLVSNAVKYSSKGIVTIKINLWKPYTTDDENQQHNVQTSAKSISSSPSADSSSRSSNSGHVTFNNDIHDKSASPTSNSKLYRLRSNTMTKNELSTAGYSYTNCSPKDPPNDVIHIRIEVADQGIGIPADMMGNLFAPFKQAQRLAGGTGLGLFSLAKRIESLNGYYGVEPRSDGQQGSVFWFSFPYQPDKASAKLHKAEMKNSYIDDDNFDPIVIIDRRFSEDFPLSAPASPMKGSQINGQDHLEKEFQQSVSKKQKNHRRSSTEGNLGYITAQLIDKIIQKTTVVDPKPTDTASNANIPSLSEVEVGKSVTVHQGSTATSFDAMTSGHTDISKDSAESDDKRSNRDIGGHSKNNSFDTVDEDTESDDGEEEDIILTPPTNTFVALNILVVDDSLPIRKVLTSMLQTQGHTVVTATNGAESLDRLAEQHAAHNGMPFDVILMDMQMPVMDGLEATRRIRAEEAKKTVKVESALNFIPEDIITVTGRSEYGSKLAANTNQNSHNIIRLKSIATTNTPRARTSEIRRQNILALSANSDDDTIASAFEVGVDEFMPKPFLIKNLYEKLQLIREKRRVD